MSRLFSRDVLSVTDPCPRCGGKLEGKGVSVEERMDLRLGRSRLAQCVSCGVEVIVMTAKQEQELADKLKRW
jgi:predicted RNA-binding Zn-ribbon protein involved in translation (DUF1610 family)